MLSFRAGFGTLFRSASNPRTNSLRIMPASSQDAAQNCRRPLPIPDPSQATSRSGVTGSPYMAKTLSPLLYCMGSLVREAMPVKLGRNPSLDGNSFRPDLHSKLLPAGQGRRSARHVLLIIRRLQRLPDLRQRLGDPSHRFFKRDLFESAASQVAIGPAVVREIQITPAQTMLVQIDAIHPPHEHESRAVSASQLLFQRLPV